MAPSSGASLSLLPVYGMAAGEQLSRSSGYRLCGGSGAIPLASGNDLAGSSGDHDRSGNSALNRWLAKVFWMLSYLHALFDFVAAYPHVAYGLVFLAALSGALPVI